MEDSRTRFLASAGKSFLSVAVRPRSGRSASSVESSKPPSPPVQPSFLSGLSDLLWERLLVPAYFLSVLIDSVFF
jgi:hypothetical protein